jgi:uncharacterized membrane protein
MERAIVIAENNAGRAARPGLARLAVWASAGFALALAGCGEGGNQIGGGPGGAGPKPVDAEKEIADLGPPATEAVRALYEGEFEATGAEPFWQLSITKDWVSFQRPGLREVGGTPARRDFRANGARIAAGPLVVTLRNTQCQHEAETYPFTAEVDFEGVPYDGCARPGGAAASASWTGELAQLIVPIDACVRRVENKPARVTIAYIDGEQATVRLLDGQGGRYECTIAAQGGEVQYFGALGDRDVLQGENDPIFTRAPAPAPTKPCAVNVEAKAPDGNVLGWVTTGC